MDRRTLGSWLNGPRATLEAQGVQLPPRGKRLGRPVEGSGAVAGFGRRLVALFLDWVLALALTRIATIGADVDGQAWDLLVLGVFAAVSWGTLAATGRTPGYLALGLRLEMARPGEPRTVWGVRTAIRTVLLTLVVPAAIWDADGRGLHDKAAGTAVVRV
ncbi:RDD family protein [Motilibacter sp. E257]|uniref:RDD family protein n=1 Tax=Motilibacter deserti TaxID=2714956 RepID=A0ABX0GRV7_9ACTN|nr:RDD family protein [Motilibacter deserti]